MKLRKTRLNVLGWIVSAAYASSLALVGLSSPALAAPQSLGPVLGTTLLSIGNGVEMALGGVGGSVRIEILANQTIHIEATPPGAAPLATGAVLSTTSDANGFERYETDQLVFLKHPAINAIVVKNPLQIVVLRTDGSLISADFPGSLQWDPATGTVTATKYAQPNERFFGMGLAGGPLDRRGRVLTMRNTDNAAYTELTSPLYSSTPFFYGHTANGTYGLFFDNPSVATFDFAKSSSQALIIAATGGTLNFYIMAGPDPAAVAKSFSALTGATPRPPKWATGYLQAHFGYASAAEVLGLAKEFRQRSIPCDAFFLDLDYTDRLFAMSWNPTTFPNPTAFNAEMGRLGFKRVNILEPLLTVFDPQWLLAANSGHLVKDSGGNPMITNIWLGDASWIDFSKASARSYFKSLMRPFLATGVSGLWADLNEPAANSMPYAVFDFDGHPRYEFATRNIYSLWESATLRDALLDAKPNERTFIVSRSGFAGIQRYAANWSGDTDSTWDSLRVQVQIANSMGLSGQNFFGADVGGFLGAPNAELFLRWLQFASFTPFMRNHSVNTSPAREPWRYGEPITSAAKATIESRYRLMPYLSSLFAEAEINGTPVLAPTFFHFPKDVATHSQNGEFMLGSAILVAPVVNEGQTQRSVYLPSAASWIDYYTGAVYGGGTSVTVSAPIHQIPLFIRRGSIVPTGPIRQFANDPTPDFLLLDIYAGDDGSITLHEDDGETLSYQNGDYRRSQLAWRETASGARMTKVPSGGSRREISRPWYVQIRNWPAAPSSVVVDGTAVANIPANLAASWSYDATQRRLTILADSPIISDISITR